MKIITAQHLHVDVVLVRPTESESGDFQWKKVLTSFKKSLQNPRVSLCLTFLNEDGERGVKHVVRVQQEGREQQPHTDD